MHSRRVYLDVWLKRTRRQLAPSGRLSELALILSREEGQAPAHWAAVLRAILGGDAEPTLDFVTSVDTLLAKPRTRPAILPEPTLW